jgi:hypothetical protein
MDGCMVLHGGKRVGSSQPMGRSDDILKEKGRTLGFHDPICDLCDFQIRAYGRVDSF